MQHAIQTKYFPPTNTRPARIRVYSMGKKTIVVPFDYTLDDPENHIFAAHKFADTYGLVGVLIGGELPNHTWAFLFQENFNHA